MQRIGLISDTHGLLRPEALAFLQGCDHIVHGGDIGSQRILDDLAAIAPVTAVRGNNDIADWARDIPDRRSLRVDGVRILVLHDVHELRDNPAPRGTRVVVSGHSHKPLVQEEEGILYVNPGSAGPRRFTLPISVALLEVRDGKAAAKLVTLQPTPKG